MTGLQAIVAIAGVGLSGAQRFLLLLPLCLSVAVVYKTTRCENLRDVPVAALILWGTIVIGIWALFTIMA